MEQTTPPADSAHTDKASTQYSTQTGPVQYQHTALKRVKSLIKPIPTVYSFEKFQIYPEVHQTLKIHFAY